MPTPEEYQYEAAGILTGLFSHEFDIPVETEWVAINNIQGIYSPRIDVAVGPFSVVQGENCIEEYDMLMHENRQLIDLLVSVHSENVEQYRTTDDPRIDDALRIPTFNRILEYNKNARCFLAIEIENQVSRKHLLGGAVNSSALGRIGIAIGWTEEKVRALVRLQAYWDFLGSVGKNTYGTDNLLILNPQQFLDAITNAT